MMEALNPRGLLPSFNDMVNVFAEAANSRMNQRKLNMSGQQFAMEYAMKQRGQLLDEAKFAAAQRDSDRSLALREEELDATEAYRKSELALRGKDLEARSASSSAEHSLKEQALVADRQTALANQQIALAKEARQKRVFDMALPRMLEEESVAMLKLAEAKRGAIEVIKTNELEIDTLGSEVGRVPLVTFEDQIQVQNKALGGKLPPKPAPSASTSSSRVAGVHLPSLGDLGGSAPTLGEGEYKSWLDDYYRAGLETEPRSSLF